MPKLCKTCVKCATNFNSTTYFYNIVILKTFVLKSRFNFEGGGGGMVRNTMLTENQNDNIHNRRHFEGDHIRYL